MKAALCMSRATRGSFKKLEAAEVDPKRTYKTPKVKVRITPGYS